MKILYNALNPSPGPIEVTCYSCRSRLEVLPDEIKHGAFGTSYVICPVCGEVIEMDDYDDFVLTADNLVYPDHFANWQTGELLDNESITRYIKDGIDYLRRNKEEYYWYTTSGRSKIDVYRSNEDKEYLISVYKSYEETMIPFEEKDYENCDNFPR